MMKVAVDISLYPLTEDFIPYLYGQVMAGFQIYDREQAPRQWTEVSLNGS